MPYLHVKTVYPSRSPSKAYNALETFTQERTKVHSVQVRSSQSFYIDNQAYLCMYVCMYLELVRVMHTIRTTYLAMRT